MAQGSTLYLRGVVIGIGLIVAALLLFALPLGIQLDNVGWYRPILIGMYLPAVPFFFALYQAMRLLSLIDGNKAFSEASVQGLKLITRCAAVISAYYAAGMPYIYMVADRDDAPGVVVIGLVIVFASAAIAVLAAILQRLLGEALALKSENELTV